LKQNTIALICDCDSTLAPDTTNFLLKENKVNIDSFWKEVGILVENGWDPPLAWMTKIMNLMNSGEIEHNTNQKLCQLGSKIETYNNVRNVIQELRTLISSNQDFVKAGIKVEGYIVSQGIEYLIKGCLDFSDFQVFAASFAEDENGKINSIKSIVTFTEKTKFLFAINKGISSIELRKAPYLVNNFIPPDQRPIPFEHMIYLGDSPNDIPSFSMVQRMQGTSVGVSGEDTFRKGFELAKGQRTTVGPYSADYSENSELRKSLKSAIMKLANDIVLKERLAGRFD